MEDADILVTPLMDDVYNRCKSQIKWLEASSAAIPGVWQKIRQYEEVIDGTNGILAKKDTEWYKAIKYLIDNPEKRKKMGEKTFKDVKKWQTQEHLEEYAQFFHQILLDK
jgi:glycosyltransferase involved in cell wall biosynthesis